MFILIPTIIIFLCLAYIQLNDDISVITQITLYGVMTITTLISFKLYKKIKNDILLQEVNSITIEINKLHTNIKNTDDEQIILGLKKKIIALEKEIEEINTI